ncbi:MAG: hypothetical protein LBC71_08470 [Oscillospiraceae bacterium]|jgi:hypothetical protein|nr:hypothetical protein [Oscillospiraceae bacterium]
MFYWAGQKAGFHIDEIFTFMQSQGGDKGRIYFYPNIYNTWIEASDLKTHITVSSEDAFTYTRSITVNGSHPPLYFYAIHTVNSLFPDVFSIWPAISLNILVYLGSLIIIYKFGILFLKDRYLSLIPVIIWGMSSAAISLVVYIRMYYLLLFFCLLFTYFVCKLVVSSKKNLYILAILITACLGIITHYYFLLYALFVSLSFGVYLLVKKEFFTVIKCSLAAGLSIFIYSLFGRSPMQVLRLGHGEVAMNNLTDGSMNISERLTRTMSLVNLHLFANVSYITVFIIAGAAICLFILNTKNKKTRIPEIVKKPETAMYILLIISTFLCFITINRTVWEIDFRYFSFLLPFFTLITIIPIIYAVKSFGINKATLFFLITLPCVILLYTNTHPLHLYKHYHAGFSSTGYLQHLELPVVSVGFNSGCLARTIYHLMLFDNMALISYKDIFNVEVLEEVQSNNGIILFLQNVDADIAAGHLNEIMKYTGLTEFTNLGRVTIHDIYLLR